MMNETLDTLWTEYFSEVCATIETEEERELARNVTAMRQAVNALASEEQIEAIQKYTDALAKMQSVFTHFFTVLPNERGNCLIPPKASHQRPQKPPTIMVKLRTRQAP